MGKVARCLVIGRCGLSQGGFHVVQAKRAFDQLIAGTRTTLIAISRVCGPVEKSAVIAVYAVMDKEGKPHNLAVKQTPDSRDSLRP
jgi:hypothetical protein